MAGGERHHWMPLLAVVAVAIVWAPSVVGQEVVVNDVCAAPIIAQQQDPNQTQLTTNQVTQDIKLWQGIVPLLCFGAFALFIALIHRVIRSVPIDILN